MNNALPLSEDKKLSVVYRVEPGCLGPQGKDYIAEFCSFAKKELLSFNSDFVVWQIVPRNDKSLPEMQFSLAGKMISPPQAERYLTIFDQSLDELECKLGDKLDTLIEQYLNR